MDRGGEYHTSINRVGLALGSGAMLAGLAAAVLVALGGDRSARAMLLALGLGAMFSALAIAAIAGPVWLTLHLAGRRGPAAATGAGAAIGFLLMLGAQLGGGSAAPWGQMIGAAFLAAALAGVIALAMWRIAYRGNS
ncbi:MAG: hypothetical protein ACTHKR_15610 [Sphingomonas sp.]